jgi:ribosomal protein L37AE/L43A
VKHREAPACPRCNRNDDVRKVPYELSELDDCNAPVRDGYVLAGTVIRPDSSDWYCVACAETFGAEREYWGRFLTDAVQ